MYTKLYSWPPRVLQTLAWGPTRLLFNIFCRFEVRGTEHLRDIRQAIFAVNHASELDSIILTAALNPFGRFSPLFYLAGPTNFFNSTSFGWRRHLYTKQWFFRAWGAYSHVPGYKDYAISLRDHVSILNDGGSMCVFPEGKRTSDGVIQRGHGGAAFLSHVTNVPIVPTTISGSYNITPKRFFDRRYRITVRFGDPCKCVEIANTHDASAHIRGTTDIVMETIRKQVEQIVPLHDPFSVRFIYWIIRTLLGPIVRTIWIRDVNGVHNIPRRGSAIVAFNHESYFDFICFIAICPRPIHFLAAEKFFAHPLWRILMMVTGQIQVNRQAQEKQETHDTVFAHLANDKVIGIFPEGTRAADPKAMQEAFTGVAQYAILAKVPIVPVGLKGTFDVMSRHMKKPRFIKRVLIRIGTPIHPEMFAHLSAEHGSYRTLTNYCMHRIAELSEKPYPHAQKTDTL